MSGADAGIVARKRSIRLKIRCLLFPSSSHRNNAELSLKIILDSWSSIRPKLCFLYLELVLKFRVSLLPRLSGSMVSRCAAAGRVPFTNVFVAFPSVVSFSIYSFFFVHCIALLLQLIRRFLFITPLCARTSAWRSSIVKDLQVSSRTLHL